MSQLKLYEKFHGTVEKVINPFWVFFKPSRVNTYMLVKLDNGERVTIHDALRRGGRKGTPVEGSRVKVWWADGNRQPRCAMIGR